MLGRERQVMTSHATMTLIYGEAGRLPRQNNVTYDDTIDTHELTIDTHKLFIMKH